MNNADDKSKVGRDWTAFVVAWIPYSLLTYRFWHNIDDAFISFRYAKNWAMGYGLRYNVGPQQPEEGYSNFLWVVSVRVCRVLGTRHYFLGTDARFRLWLFALVPRFSNATARFRHGARCGFLHHPGPRPFPTLRFVVDRWHGHHGVRPFHLRDSLLSRSTLGGHRALLRCARRCGHGVVAYRRHCLGFAHRPAEHRHPTDERGTVWRPVAVYVAIVGTAFSVYFAWRYSYYQLLFPNPVYAKVGFSPEVALRGFRYVASFALTFVTPILLLPTAGYVAWREAPKPVALALGTLSLAFPAYAVVVGGDWMAMGRFLVPGFAFGALLMGWLVAGLWEHLSSMVETATVARLVKPFVFAVLIGSTIAVGLLPTWNVHLVPASVLRHAFYFRYGWPRHTEYERWIDSNEHLHRSKEIALTLKQHFEPKDSVVTGAVGALGYYSGLHIYDKTGLVDRLVAMRGLDASDALRMPGHDKTVDEGFFLHLEPTVVKVTPGKAGGLFIRAPRRGCS